MNGQMPGRCPVCFNQTKFCVCGQPQHNQTTPVDDAEAELFARLEADPELQKATEPLTTAIQAPIAVQLQTLLNVADAIAYLESDLEDDEDATVTAHHFVVHHFAEAVMGRYLGAMARMGYRPDAQRWVDTCTDIVRCLFNEEDED